MKNNSIPSGSILRATVLAAMLIAASSCTNKKFEDAQIDHAVSSAILTQVIAAGTASCTPTGTSPSFTTLATGFNTYCASCHTGAGAANNFDVNLYSSVVARVTKGNPTQSLLSQKIKNTPPVGTMSGKIPANAAGDAFRLQINDWILGCAVP